MAPRRSIGADHVGFSTDENQQAWAVVRGYRTTDLDDSQESQRPYGGVRLDIVGFSALENRKG
jgi:hypothetical protein